MNRLKPYDIYPQLSQRPTMRYHDSTFYIITTNVYQPSVKEEPTQFINFIITAKQPEGPWSDQVIISGAPGIDPDIFFDDDGKIWYTGTHAPKKKFNFQGEGEIWVQELNSESSICYGICWYYLLFYNPYSKTILKTLT